MSKETEEALASAAKKQADATAREDGRQKVWRGCAVAFGLPVDDRETFTESLLASLAEPDEKDERKVTASTVELVAPYAAQFVSAFNQSQIQGTRDCIADKLAAAGETAVDSEWEARVSLPGKIAELEARRLEADYAFRESRGSLTDDQKVKKVEAAVTANVAGVEPEFAMRILENQLKNLQESIEAAAAAAAAQG